MKHVSENYDLGSDDDIHDFLYEPQILRYGLEIKEREPNPQPIWAAVKARDANGDWYWHQRQPYPTMSGEWLSEGLILFAESETPWKRSLVDVRFDSFEYQRYLRSGAYEEDLARYREMMQKSIPVGNSKKRRIIV